MPGKRIPDLPAIAGASTANDDNLVIFDTDASTTKRILRSQLAAGLVGDLPYTPAGFISATTVPTAIAEIASDLAASSGSNLVGFLQSGTGATARTAQAKMRDVVSVKDFGAVGDGVADDTAAIQTALNSTAKNIYFGDALCNYKITSGLTSSVADRFIFGHGAKISPTTAISGSGYALSVSGAGSEINGLNFVGVANTTLCGALIIFANKITVRGNAFSDFTNGGGIVSNSLAPAAIVTNNRLNNCNPVVLGGLQYGSIHINGADSTVSENIIIDCDLTGVSTAGAPRVRILGNYIIGKSGSTTAGGIIMDGAATSCVIANNTIKDMAVEGIQIANNDAVTGAVSTSHIVANNVIQQCAVSAITLAGDTATSLEKININGNQIYSTLTTARAIEIIRGLKTNITGNYVYGYGVGVNIVQASPDTTVCGNTFENQYTTAIQTTRYMCISGNKVIGNGAAGTTTGISFNGATSGGEQIIVGNQIRNCLNGIVGTFSGTQRTYINSNHFIGNGTDMSLTSRTTNSTNYNVTDKILSGEFTLVAGAATITNNQLSADDKIAISKKTAGGTAGAVFVNTRTNGTGFTVSSTSATDTSTYYYEFVR